MAVKTDFAIDTSAFSPNLHQKPHVTVFDLIANRACLVFEKTNFTYVHVRIEVVVVAFFETLQARVTVQATNKTAHVLVSRYFSL